MRFLWWVIGRQVQQGKDEEGDGGQEGKQKKSRSSRQLISPAFLPSLLIERAHEGRIVCHNVENSLVVEAEKRLVTLDYFSYISRGVRHASPSLDPLATWAGLTSTAEVKVSFVALTPISWILCAFRAFLPAGRFFATSCANERFNPEASTLGTVIYGVHL